jgi:hypothetical protein
MVDIGLKGLEGKLFVKITLARHSLKTFIIIHLI